MDLANASNEALLLLAQQVFPDVEVEKAKTANAGAGGKENKSPSTPPSFKRSTWRATEGAHEGPQRSRREGHREATWRATETELNKSVKISEYE
jgi:hypothetical protein